jgi:hypothetical protein
VNDIEKLRVVLPHWLEHNQEHAAEFASWADRASASGQETVAREIRRAAEVMQQANEALQAALAELGGAGHLPHHGHTH